MDIRTKNSVPQIYRDRLGRYQFMPARTGLKDCCGFVYRFLGRYVKYMDMEKIKTGIFEMLQRDTWKDIDKERHRFQPVLNNALALLKKHDAVEPKTEPSAKGYWFSCGACGWLLFEVRDSAHFDDRKRIRYCASCGEAVKWK